MQTGPTSPRPTPLLEDQTYTIETPEHVRIVYPLAGPGSRLLAALLDFVIMIIPSLLAFFLVVLVIASLVSREMLEETLGGRTPAGQEEFVVWLVLAFFSMVQFVLMWFYFVIFEVAWNGQSPGKRAVNIRVIRDGGQPVGLFTAMIRNLIRVVDFMPLFYLVGFVAMLASRNWRRLGDLAAGTVVVMEDDRAGAAGAPAVPDVKAQAGAAWPPPETDSGDVDPMLSEKFRHGGLLKVDDEFFELAGRFLDRRHQLEDHVSRHLAEKIARPVMDRVGIAGTDPQRFIEQALAYRRSEG